MSFSKIFVAATALASLVLAAPVNIPRDVVSVVTETAYTTIDVPVTVWVDESGKPIRTEVPAQAGNFATQSPTSDLKSRSGGVCSGSSSNCVGDITHYDGGLGACGWNVNTNSDMQIALPVGLMGAQSNGNPYCGQSVTIKNPNTGATVQATVGDKCMGCSGDSIDLTNVLFTAIGGGCDGRCSGFQWWFN